MAAQDTNPRFPHKVEVRRVIVNTKVNPPTSTKPIILKSSCRNFPPRSGGSDYSGGVFASDYILSMPLQKAIVKIGDLVYVSMEDGSVINGVVVNSHKGNLGFQIWHNEVKN